jgi:hypothetical protein
VGGDRNHKDANLFIETVTEEWVNGVVFHDWKRGVLKGLKIGTPNV